MSKDNVEKVAKIDINKVDVTSKLEFVRKVDSGALIMSIQKDLMRAHDFAMSQERPTTYVLSDFSIQLKTVVSQEADKTMFVLPSKPGELDPNSMSLVNINLKPIPLEVKPATSIRPVEAVEGIGVVIGGKLREIGISTVGDLARASSADIVKLGVPAKKASEFISMAKLMTKSAIAGVEGVDEQVAELLVVGGQIDSKEKLAQSNPEELLKTLNAAMQAGKVKVPARTSYATEDVSKWVTSAKTFVDRNRLEQP